MSGAETVESASLAYEGETAVRASRSRSCAIAVRYKRASSCIDSPDIQSCLLKVSNVTVYASPQVGLQAYATTLCKLT